MLNIFVAFYFNCCRKMCGVKITFAAVSLCYIYVYVSSV